MAQFARFVPGVYGIGLGGGDFYAGGLRRTDYRSTADDSGSDQTGSAGSTHRDGGIVRSVCAGGSGKGGMIGGGAGRNWRSCGRFRRVSCARGAGARIASAGCRDRDRGGCGGDRHRVADCVALLAAQRNQGSEPAQLACSAPMGAGFSFAPCAAAHLRAATHGLRHGLHSGCRSRLAMVSWRRRLAEAAGWLLFRLRLLLWPASGRSSCRGCLAEQPIARAR